jgi:ceramide glucosyltransferase
VRLSALLGDNWLAMTLVIVAAGLVVGDFLATLFSVIYQRFWYDRVLRPRYDPQYSPSCAVIVPCKGKMKNLEQNVRSFLDLDYPSYRVYYVVESESDPAVNTLRRVAQENPKRASVVVAGLATRCAQKNHNLLAAVRQATEAEVYAFADADIGPKGNWLRELLLPLSIPGVSVTTGFRWLSTAKPGLGEMVHNYVSIFLYVLLCVASFFGEVGVWGGSMAIRRRDFEEMDIEGLWSRSVVDDISLSSRIHASGKQTVMVPSCVTRTDDLIETVGEGIVWFERQIMFLKAYHRGLWLYGAAPIVLLGAAVLLWLPFALVASMSEHRTFLALGGAAPLLLIAGEAATALLYPLLGDMPRFGRFLALQPFLRSTHILSYLRTMFTNVVTWSGVRYYLDREGVVTRVERND